MELDQLFGGVMTRELPELSVLGLGFDVLGKYSSKSCRARVVPMPADRSGELQIGEKTYSYPHSVLVLEGTGDFNLAGLVYTFESGQEVQSSFATKAKVKGTYGSFAGEAEALYGQESSDEHSYWYAYLEAGLDVFTMSMPDLSPSPEFLADPDVKAMLENQTFDSSAPDVFFNVFRKFGTHVLTRATVGGNIRYVETINKSAATDKQTAGVKLNAEYKAALLDASADASVDWSTLGQAWANSRTVNLDATGGDESLLMPALHPGFDDNFSTAYTAWVKTIRQEPKMTSFELTALSRLFSGKVAQALDQAITAYTDNGIYVEARIAGQDLSGTVEVSHRNVDQRPWGGSGPSGGAQLVVFDASSLAPVFNRTVYGGETPGGPALWLTLFDGIDALPTSTYFCALTVFNWSAGVSPTGEQAKWLRRCGASLDAWEALGRISDAYPVTYAFVGRSDSPPGQGNQQFDWDRGQGTGFASVTTPLFPQAGGGFSLTDAAR
jgi:hypothetical protein